MAKINKIGRAAHRLHNPARDLLYEYADMQRELDLQINEVEELERMEPDRLRDELIARVQKRIERGIEREQLLREKVDAMLAGIKMPKHREAPDPPIHRRRGLAGDTQGSRNTRKSEKRSAFTSVRVGRSKQKPRKTGGILP